jgi:hypothetical protein
MGSKGDSNMAIGKRVRIMTWATSDNRANSFTLHLPADPYWVGSEQPSGIGGRISNWFADVSILRNGLTRCCAPGAAACTGISL